MYLEKTIHPPMLFLDHQELTMGEADNKNIIVLPEQKFVVASIAAEGKIIVPPILKVKQGIVTLMHDHPTARHPG
jgi:hypothetical protein